MAIATLRGGFKYSGPAPVVSSLLPNTGVVTGGTSVAVTGTDFVSGAVVRINGIICTNISFVSPTSITCDTPAGVEGAQTVRVTNPDLQFDDLAAGFTYTPVAPSVVAIVPAIGTEAGGTAVVIEVVDSAGATSAAVGGVALIGFAIDDGTHVSGTTGVHAVGAVDVTVTNPGGTGTLVNGFTYTPDAAVPVVSAVSYDVVDPAGGGERVVVTVNDSTGCTAIKSDVGGGEVAWTSFAIDDGTHVSGIPGAHASGVVDVVVTNATGDSTTGTGLIEYFCAHDLTPTCELLPGAYAVIGTQGVDAVGTWTDASGSANHAQSLGGVNAPPVSALGTPDFVPATAEHLHITQSLASAGGSPPDMATLGAGTQCACFEADAGGGAASLHYEDAVILCGNGASAGICYSDDGIAWEAYDEGAFADYRRTTDVAAATGVKHFAAGRWNGTAWQAKANGGAFAGVTADSAVLSNGNVGAATEIGRSYGGTRYYDGRVNMVLVFATALSDANVNKIRAWAQQRGWAA